MTTDTLPVCGSISAREIASVTILLSDAGGCENRVNLDDSGCVSEIIKTYVDDDGTIEPPGDSRPWVAANFDHELGRLTLLNLYSFRQQVKHWSFRR
jgi:hypothetical protein